MNKSTKTHWQWTEVAEKEWDRIVKESYPGQNLEPRRAGQMITHLEGAYRVPRKTVHKSWVDKGYVKEAEAEQISLF